MIGIFDSGFGGLTIFRDIKKLLPEYDFLYLGDSARAPYGNRTQETIYHYSVEAMEWMFAQGCPLIIIACNSVSSEALRRLQQEWLPAHYPDRRILGVLIPIAQAVAVASKSGRVGVIGTRATIESKSYIRELEKVRPGLMVFQKACPLLVPLIEEGWEKKPETRKILRSYLAPLKHKQIDTLILGCTHYPILLRDIRATMGRRVSVPDPGPIVAASLQEYLARHPEIETGLSKRGASRFVTTGSVEHFNCLGTRFFGSPVAAECADL